MDKVHEGRKCLVLDLDETLLHSSFKVSFDHSSIENKLTRVPQMLPSADYIVPVEIESQTHNVYVIKRPGVDHFLKEMGKIYEVVIFTASLSKVGSSSVRTGANPPLHSMPTLCLICSTFTGLSDIDYSEKAATTTKATTSRQVLFSVPE